MVGEAWEGSGRILWKFWRKARSQSGQNFIFFGNSRIPYPDGNQNFKINAVILSQIVLILEKKITKNRPDMEVRTIFSGKSRGGQVQSGQISGAAVRTKVFRIRPPLPLPGVLVTLRNSRTPESHLRGVRQSRIKIWNFGLRYQFIRIKIVKFWTRFARKFG